MDGGGWPRLERSAALIAALWVAGASIGVFVLAVPFSGVGLFPGYPVVVPAISAASIVLVAAALIVAGRMRRLNPLLLAATAAHVAGQASLIAGILYISGCQPSGPCSHVLILFIISGLALALVGIILVAVGSATRTTLPPFPRSF